MNSSVDILVPVWNNPFETRSCIAAILAHSPGARLVIVDNGSSRETELMIEEFSETLGDQGLFIKSEKNIGLIAAINLGLARSDSDFTVIVRPHVTVHAGWLDVLVGAAESSGAGIISPLFKGGEESSLPQPAAGCSIAETCSVSFSTLLLRTEMRMIAGSFDENLDGGEWCLKDYVRRVAEFGYRCCITGSLRLSSAVAQQFGSAQRRNETIQKSRTTCISRWGVPRHYCIYFGTDADVGSLEDTVAAILDGARRGNRFTVMLHSRQYSGFRKKGWLGMHTGIDLIKISPLFPLRDLHRKVGALKSVSPDLLPVRGCSGAAFPGIDAAISHDELLRSMQARPATPKETPL